MNNWFWIGGAVVGAISGFLYGQQIGCVSGMCPITSSPLVSTAYGAVMGLLMGGIFQRDQKPKDNK